MSVVIPAKPAPELPAWELPPPCGKCESCKRREQVEFAVTYLSAHFARTIELLDPRLPNYLHLVDRLMAEREVEVAKLRDGLPYCDQPVTLVVGG